MRRKIGMGFELTNREKESRDGAGGEGVDKRLKEKYGWEGS